MPEDYTAIARGKCGMQWEPNHSKARGVLDLPRHQFARRDFGPLE